MKKIARVVFVVVLFLGMSLAVQAQDPQKSQPTIFDLVRQGKEWAERTQFNTRNTIEGRIWNYYWVAKYNPISAALNQISRSAGIYSRPSFFPPSQPGYQRWVWNGYFWEVR